MYKRQGQHRPRGTLGELLLTQGAAGSVLATGVTLVIVPMLAHGNEMARYHDPVSYTHLRAHETKLHLVCRLLLEKKNNEAVNI